jgi:hypothetical protein
MIRRLHLPQYAQCACGEFEPIKLRRKLISGEVKCHNCAEPRKTSSNIRQCWICGKLAPTELHHVFGRKANDLMYPVCLNCHAEISYHLQRVMEMQNGANALVKIITMGLSISTFITMQYTNLVQARDERA